MSGTAGISRSGRVRKKSAKLIEMEDVDTTELDLQGKIRKKFKSVDDSDGESDKKVAPLKIPKLSLGLSSPNKKSSPESSTSVLRVPVPLPAHARVGHSLEERHSMMEDKGSVSCASPSIESSESSSSSSSSSSDDSDLENLQMTSNIRTATVKKIIPQERVVKQISLIPNKPALAIRNPSAIKLADSSPKYAQSPIHLSSGGGSELSSFRDFSADDDDDDDHEDDDSDEDTNEHTLVIAEDAKQFFGSKKKVKSVERPKPKPKTPPKKLKANESVPERFSQSLISKKPKKKLPQNIDKEVKGKGKRAKDKDKQKSRPMTAYMLWCQANRKKIVAQNPVMDFSSISKKMGELWQSLPEKDKMAWKSKAKKAENKGSTIISTGKIYDQPTSKFLQRPSLSSLKVDDSKGLPLDTIRTLGTSPIDVAAHLKLLGESLSIIGERLTEHEGQIAVSGSLSVLLDSTLCALGPLLCLTSQVNELNGCSQDKLNNILDNIAYIMPGL